MSKNLLSENMIRFGTKNLSERQERELVVKAIMETINQHGLHGEVRSRLIAEQSIVFPKRQPELEKQYAGSAEVKYGVNPTMTGKLPMTVKPGSYTTKNYFGAFRSDLGSSEDAANYIYIPKGTVFKADPNTNCIYAIVQKGTGWKSGSAPKVGANGQALSKADMMYNDSNGTIISQLKTAPVQVSYDLSNGALITQGDIPYRVSDTLLNALNSALRK
jgi:hypothetical protein